MRRVGVMTGTCGIRRSGQRGVNRSVGFQVHSIMNDIVVPSSLMEERPYHHRSSDLAVWEKF